MTPRSGAVSFAGVDVGGLEATRTRRSASGRAALVVETARDTADRDRSAELVAAATPLARRAVRRLVLDTGWDGRWRGAVEVLPDATLAVAGGTVRRAHRPGEPNTFDLVVRLPYVWLDRVLRLGLTVVEGRFFVVDRSPEQGGGSPWGGPSVVELLSYAPDQSVEGTDRAGSRGSYRFGLATALVGTDAGPGVVSWI